MGTETTYIEPTTPGSSDPSTSASADTPARDALLSLTRTAAMRLGSADATEDDFLVAMHTLAALKQAARDYAAMVDDAALEYLDRHGAVETPTERYYLGKSRTTRCRDTGRCIESILAATGGDLDKLADLLASQPLKHGACKGVLGDEWDRHFEVVEKDKVEVKRVDPAQLPARAGGKEG